MFSLGTGSTYTGTAGSWVAANVINATGSTSVVSVNGATFNITGVQVELGSTATPFEFRPIGTELALCQRYYYTGGSFIFAPLNSDNIVGNIGFPVTMKSTPNITVYSMSSIADRVTRIDGAGLTTVNVRSIGVTNTNIMSIQPSPINSFDSAFYQFTLRAEAEL